MHVILLSGGSGMRLWPLSNEVRAKQFIKIFKGPDGSYESMVQRMYRMILKVDETASITIATSANQIPEIKDQLGGKVGISVEPCRRDTFPAIALATAYLHDVQHVSEDDVVVVCPVDPYAEAAYFSTLKEVCYQASIGETNLVLMGVEPTYPSEKYGYIIPSTYDHISNVKAFKEKPDMKHAMEYLRQNALWNAGVFAYKLRYLLEISNVEFGTSSYQKLYSKYINLKKCSFDYAVVEKEKKIKVVKYTGEWKDLGTWNTFTEVMDASVSGKATTVDCDNTHIINELHIPLIALGLKNLAVVATPDGILITDKGKSDKLKEYVLPQRPMYEKSEWGEYKVLDYWNQTDGKNSLTKHIVIKSGFQTTYHKHSFRKEVLTIIEGTGSMLLDGTRIEISRGFSFLVEPGMKHALVADTELHVIEIQIGDILTEDDIESLDWE